MKKIQMILIALGMCFFFLAEINAQNITIENRQKKEHFIAMGHPYKYDTYAMPFAIEKVNDTWFRLTNSGRALCFEGEKLTMRKVKPGWWSAQWRKVPTGSGYFRLQCRMKGGIYHLNIQSGKLECSKLGSMDWWSAQWKFNDYGDKMPDEKSDFYMVIGADPQYPWSDDGVTRTKDEKKKHSEEKNMEYVNSINAHVNAIGKNRIKGFIINGDLTEYGHGWQLKKFKEMYGKVSIPLYLGLGNHDYANNVDDTYENGAANGMVEYMIDHIKERKYKNYDFKESESYEFPEIVRKKTGSLAYSWDMANVHFVQLHNFPTYEKSWSNYVSVGDAARKTVEIKNSLEWLEEDLAKARNAGKAIILNFHDANDGAGKHWQDLVKLGAVADKFSPSGGFEAAAQKNIDDFLDMLATYKVSAIFVGHLHSSVGKIDEMNNVPVIYSGSPTHNRYLTVRFLTDSMYVMQMNSSGGNAKTVAGSLEKFKLNVGKPSTSLPMPSRSGSITFFNKAAYVAKYLLSYMIDGKWVNHHTGNMLAGNKKTYTIPKEATEIWIKGEGKTGLIWEPWRQTFRFKVGDTPTGIDNCYKSTGTTLHQNWNTDCN